MVPFLYFLLFFLLLFGAAYGLTVWRMNGGLSGAGPARVGAALKSRNRAILLFFVVVLVITAVMEALIPDVSLALENLQYAVGDLVESEPALVYDTDNGSVSWGLYLGILLGALGGLVAGTMTAARRYPVLRGLGPRDVV